MPACKPNMYHYNKASRSIFNTCEISIHINNVATICRAK